MKAIELSFYKLEMVGQINELCTFSSKLAHNIWKLGTFTSLTDLQTN